MHSVPSQQPVGQEVPSQTQAPDTQRWPVPQTAPVPQAQAPATHASALAASQARQACPAGAHALVEVGVHTPAAQQPVWQVSGPHFSAGVVSSTVTWTS